MGMRITGSMMVNNFNKNLQTANRQMFRFQNQLATGRKMVRLSDDPVNVVKALDARAQLYNIEQYKRNLEDANTWLTQTETALRELNEVIKRVYELSVYANNDVLSEDDRNAMAMEINELRNQVDIVSNVTLGDRYIFGGFNVTRAPFAYDPETGDMVYNGESMMAGDIDEDRISFQINFGGIIENHDDRLEAFNVGMMAKMAFGTGEQNIYFIMSKMFDLLSQTSDRDVPDTFEETYTNTEADPNTEFSPFPQVLLDAQNRLLTQIAEVGGRIARIDLMRDRFNNDEINYTQMKSDVEDLDHAEAIMWFSMAEAVYRSALGVGGRILPPSLIDFLR